MKICRLFFVWSFSTLFFFSFLSSAQLPPDLPPLPPLLPFKLPKLVIKQGTFNEYVEDRIHQDYNVIRDEGALFFKGRWDRASVLDIDFKKFLVPSEMDIRYRNRLVRIYKIHLMPAHGRSAEVVSRIFDRALVDEQFSESIDQVKYLKNDIEPVIVDEMVLPRIVIYLAPGQRRARRFVRKLAEMLSDIPGLEGVEPRFNMKYNDLIYYAQGNADNKTVIIERTETALDGKQIKDICFDPERNFALYKTDFIPGILTEQYLL
jgi:hypothetical protein